MCAQCLLSLKVVLDLLDLGLTATWLLGTEPKPSGRAASALSGQALSPAPLSQPLCFIWLLYPDYNSLIIEQIKHY